MLGVGHACVLRSATKSITQIYVLYIQYIMLTVQTCINFDT